MYAYLSILNGERIGCCVPLSVDSETLMGRGEDCQICLPDPLCSRVHARIAVEEGVWVVRDATSRNGTFVNGQKVAEATLDIGHHLRIGSTEMELCQSSEPLTTEGNGASPTQTIVQNISINSTSEVEPSISGLPSGEQIEELMLLYQLSIRLLGSGDADRVVTIALDLLHKRTGASVVGFLWTNDEGQLRPKHVTPPDAANQVQLSPSLTELVSKQCHAVWVANQEEQEGGDTGIGHFSDAICAPLVHRVDGDKTTLGAIHVYLHDGHFRQSDFDFIISVANLVAIALRRAIELSSLQSDFDRLAQHAPGHDGLIGESDAMTALKARINRVAKAAGSVLIRGESGAGKELVARAVHAASPRHDYPMVSVNCAAIPTDLMESQLFGHKAGSFTGADRDHNGYFQQADLGTLFLDEVGELTLEGQAKLLRILEGHPFLPVGATEPISVDVRVIAATNQDLQQYVRDKRFREDLYYRLSVFELQLPPLRQREGDLDLLIDFFLDHFRKEHGRPTLQLSDTARGKLRRYHWPGNVRQLRNVIDSAVVMADAPAIEPLDLALRDSGGEELDTLEIDKWERKLIIEALKRTSNSVPEAAKLLGIGRATLYRKIEQYHIER